jgi:hypothetical protein
LNVPSLPPHHGEIRSHYMQRSTSGQIEPVAFVTVDEARELLG